jgi:hypothetical protein
MGALGGNVVRFAFSGVSRLQSTVVNMAEKKIKKTGSEVQP